MIVHLTVYILCIYVLSLYMRDMGIMDIAWGIGFIFLTSVAYFAGPQSILALIVYMLIVVWGLRLSLHIFMRHKGEDWRYKNWRKEWGKTVWWRSLLQVFILQGVIMYIVCLPVLILVMYPTTFSTWVYAGLVVWLLGFLCETIADWQVREHRKKHRTILMNGLWKYSRHPNYFGEAVQWWGFTIMCVPTILSYNLWWVIASPVLITYLVRYVSGVPMLEKKFMKATGYKDYMKRTNAFIPWFPK